MTSTEMLKNDGGVLLCLHTLLSFAKMTQKLWDFVALPLRVSHGQHIKIYDGFPFGFTGRCPQEWI